MGETVGQQLQNARVRRKIPVEEAARATRIRPDRLIDLENDNYTNFPSLTYAKGFLTMYGRYLGVDVSEFAQSLDVSPEVGVGEYEYLQATGPEPPVEHGEPSSGIKPVIFSVFLVIVGALAIYGFLLFKKLERVAPALRSKTSATPAKIAAASPKPTVTAAKATPTATPVLAIATPFPVEGPLPDNLPVRRAVPIDLKKLAAATPAPAQPVVHEIVLRATKKTFVKVQTDVDSAPVFEDYLSPESAPLKLNGPRFWVFLRDSDAVEIVKDGEPVPYDSKTGIWIQ